MVPKVFEPLKFDCTHWAYFGYPRIEVVFVRTLSSDQTARMRTLLVVFVGRTCQKLRFFTLRLITIYDESYDRINENPCLIG